MNETIPLVDLRNEYAEIKAEIDHAIERVVQSTSFIMGEEVASFEEAFSSLCGIPYTLGVGSGTDALYLALIALDIGQGDEVITSPLTFIATAEAISMTGATPVFVDVSRETHNIDTACIEEHLTRRTRAILPVHLHGQPADMKAIKRIASDHELFIIQDAAQAHGAMIDDVPIAKYGGLTCFSFYPGKNLGAYGDAGAIVTEDSELAEKIQMLRNHGRTEKYVHELIGFNFRIDAIQAAIINAKLPHLTRWNGRRKEIAQRYIDAFADLPLRIPVLPSWAGSVWHHFTIETDDRDDLARSLKQNGISTGIHYPLPLHIQPAYGDLGYKKGAFPIAESIAESVLSLPIYGTMPDDKVERVIAEVQNHYR